MANVTDSGVCDLIGFGRAAVLEPLIPTEVILNEDVPDDIAVALPHILRGLWLARLIPVKVVGSGLVIELFYWNMRHLRNGMKSDPYARIPCVVLANTWGMTGNRTSSTAEMARRYLQSIMPRQHVKTD